MANLPQKPPNSAVDQSFTATPGGTDPLCTTGTQEAPRGPTRTYAVPDLQGKTVGRYELQAIVGRGGFGVVYRGYDPVLKRHVAVKVPTSKSDDGLSDAAADAFIREGQALARLSHKNIVAVYDTGKTADGQPYIVMEFVEGLAMSRLSKSTSRERLVSYTTQVAAALDYAHEQGLVHRDLKPGNVLITRKGFAKVCDFGLAIDELTMSDGSVSGTPGYMSPEQVSGGSNSLDRRSDIWSLGVMLYEQLTGTRPFSGTDRDELFDNILNRPARPLTEIRSDVPKSIESVCLQCLNKDPQDRPQSAQVVIEALESASLPRQRSTNSVVVVAITCAVVLGVALGIGVGIYQWWQPSTPPVSGLLGAMPEGDIAPTLTLDAIAWPTTSKANFYKADPKLGSIEVRSVAFDSAFRTTGPTSNNYSVTATCEFLSDHAMGGIAFGIRQTSIDPPAHRCWAVRLETPHNAKFGTCISVEELEIGMNDLLKSDVLGGTVLKRVFRTDGTIAFEMKLVVEDGRPKSLWIDGIEVTEMPETLSTIRLPVESSCGIYATGHLVFHSLKYEDL